jgi:hypothetical protein
VLTKNGSRLTSIESPWVPHMRAAVGGAAHVRHSQKLADCDPNVPDPAEASPLSPPNGAVVPDPTGNISKRSVQSRACGQKHTFSNASREAKGQERGLVAGGVRTVGEH